MWGLKDKEYLDPLTSALSHLGLRHPLLSHRLRLRRHNQTVNFFTRLYACPQGPTKLPTTFATPPLREWYERAAQPGCSLKTHRVAVRNISKKHLGLCLNIEPRGRDYIPA